MKTIEPFEVTKENIEKVRTLINAKRSDWFVTDRQKHNVDGPAPLFDRDEFWYVLLGCLLTTQQRSTQGSPVNRFLDQKPFPLSLEACARDVEKRVASILENFGGIRMSPTIAARARKNYEWLHSGGWSS